MTTRNIYQKLMAASMNFADVVKNKTNPFYNNSKYEDLNSVMAAVEPALAAEGLLLMQPIVNGNIVCTRIVNIENPTEIVESSMTIPDVITDAQKRCSAVTYFRRTTLKALLTLPCIDDDGNSLVDKKLAASKTTFTAPKKTETITAAPKVANTTPTASNGTMPSFKRNLKPTTTATTTASDDV